MLLDGRSLPDGERLETDLCIIGCGPAGIVMARALSSSGLGLIVLESGGTARDKEIDRLGEGVNAGDPYPALWTTRARGIGGTSLHWQMTTSDGDEGWIARPLDPLDFMVRPGIPDSGWPIDFASLEPYYRAAQPLAGLADHPYLPDATAADRPFDIPPEEVVTTLFQRSDLRLAERADGLRDAPGVRLVHHATVLELRPDDSGGRIGEAIVATGGDRRIRVAARRFVLATGGIDNARLLLASRSRSSAGIGNGHDLVGRYFMERLSGRAGVLIPGGRDLVARAGLYSSHLVGGTRIQGVLTLAPERVVEEGLRNAAFWVRARPRPFTVQGVQSALALSRMVNRRPIRPSDIPAHLVNVARDLPDVIRTIGHHTVDRRERPHDVFNLGFQAEQAPNADSRVTLDDRLDRSGMPTVRLAWRPTDDDRRSIVRSVDLLDATLRRARLGRLTLKFGDVTPQPRYVGNWHHMGTTRMSDDPHRGVVDRTGRVHGLTNLYIAGSSVFPTAGFANPTLTIIALSLRLADELRGGPWGEPPP